MLYEEEMKNITRADLSEAVYRDLGLSYTESEKLVDLVFEEIIKAFEANEDVKISSFASFYLKKKKARVGRNPKTGKEYPITSRTILSFCPSQTLKNEVAAALKNKD